MKMLQTGAPFLVARTDPLARRDGGFADRIAPGQRVGKHKKLRETPLILLSRGRGRALGSQKFFHSGPGSAPRLLFWFLRLWLISTPVAFWTADQLAYIMRLPN